MLHAICTATVEMAATAIGPATGAHVLGNALQVWRLNHFAAALGPFPGDCSRVTCQRTKLPVVASRVMTNQALHSTLYPRWLLVPILPSITHMAGCAAGLIGYRHAAKAVDDLAFAKGLPGFCVLVKPGPVGSAPNLLAGFGMAFQAGGGYIFCPFKRALQCLELTVICRSGGFIPGHCLVTGQGRARHKQPQYRQQPRSEAPAESFCNLVHNIHQPIGKYC